ncbi:MAG TPA: S8/S53 family peptidase [Actinomycetes bacterium]|nr:S8/S53 family peptidase [Actinomycetes bacterium]
MDRDDHIDQHAAHGGWWPGYIAHHGPGMGGRHHYHYVRDQLIVPAGAVERAGNELADLGVAALPEANGELGLVLLALDPATTEGYLDRHVPTLVARLEERWEDAARSVAPNHVLGPCSHIHADASAPEPTGWRAATVEEVAAQVAAEDEPLPGAGATVGVLDTGFEDKAWFDGRVEGDAERAIQDESGRLLPTCGHGTFVAGVVLQYAPGARVLVRRVFSDEGVVDDWRLALGLLELVDARVDVVNMSIGSYTRKDYGMPAFEAALGLARYRRPDLVLVASAGNEGLDRPYYPAADERVLGVGAVEQDARGRWLRADFTNFGAWWVGACAPGVDVHSTFLNYQGMVVPHHDDPHDDRDEHKEDPAYDRCGGEAYEPGKPRILDFQGTARWSGTSFSTPVVAAAVATGMGRGASPRAALESLLGDPGLPRMQNLGVLIDPRSYG